MFFGGSNGFNAFYADQIVDNLNPPSVLITDFQLANKPVPIGADSVLQKSILETDKLVLSYRDRVFSFEFAALNYRAPEQNRYKFRMEGFDKEWNEVGITRRFATYTNLDPGEYVFRVIGSNNDGIWSEEGASIHISVTPPWWETTLFRMSMVVLAIGALIGGYRWRVSAIDARRRELETQVQERTIELRKLSQATENSPASVVVTDKNGTIEYVNPTFCEVTGYSAEEAIGQNPSVLKSGDLPESYYKELWDTILSGKVWRGEFRNKRKNGEKFWESASISPIMDEDGEITHFVAVKQDITERKAAEEAIRASEEKSRLLLESVGEGIFGVDLDGKVAFINPAANRMLGYGPEELIGVDVHQKIHHSHADGSAYPKIKCPMYLTHADGTDQHIADEVLWRKDGSSFPVEYTSMPIKKDEQVVGAVVTFMDITERKRMELEILAAMEKAKEEIGRAHV